MVQYRHLGLPRCSWTKKKIFFVDTVGSSIGATMSYNDFHQRFPWTPTGHHHPARVPLWHLPRGAIPPVEVHAG